MEAVQHVLSPVGESVQSSEAAVERAYECPICHEVLFDPVTTHCAHSFCRRCIAAALRRDPRCPCCRAVQVPDLLQPNAELRAAVARDCPNAYDERARANASSVLFVGSTGSGKSAAINYLCGERVCGTNAFERETQDVAWHARTLPAAGTEDGLDTGGAGHELLAFRLIDTPGLLPHAEGRAEREEDTRENRCALDKIVRFVTKGAEEGRAGETHAHCVAWVERADLLRPEGDRRTARALTERLGAGVWRRAALLLTHAEGTPDAALAARLRSMREAIREASGDAGAPAPPHALLSCLRGRPLPPGCCSPAEAAGVLARVARAAEADPRAAAASAASLARGGPPFPIPAAAEEDGERGGWLASEESGAGWEVVVVRTPEPWPVTALKAFAVGQHLWTSRYPLWLKLFQGALALLWLSGFSSVSVRSGRGGSAATLESLQGTRSYRHRLGPRRAVING
eukprot:tig00020563_g11382.t1